MVVRLLAATAVVGAATVAVTGWLTAVGTTDALRAEAGQTLADDAHIYDVLLGHAATHADWNGVGDVVADLARDTGRRVVLTNRDRTVLADSAPDEPLPRKSASNLDALDVNVALAEVESLDGIDYRAVGPYRLSAGEKAESARRAKAIADCLRRAGAEPEVLVLPTGRSVVPPEDEVGCGLEDQEPAPSEAKALAHLNAMVDACLAQRGARPVRLSLELDGTIQYPADRNGDNDVVLCVQENRGHQLTGTVAPPALLFLADPPGAAWYTGIGLWPLVLAGAVVLLVMLAVSAVLAARLLRPVHALAETAQRMRDGDHSARVEVRDQGETGRLAELFNDLSEHLERVERQRRDMIGDISHELRSPLTTLRGWLEAAADGQRPMEPALVNVLLDETLTLQQLIDDLQDLALAEAGQLSLHSQPLAAADVLRSVAVANQAAADELGLALVVDAPEDLVVHADPVRLRQMVANLTSNALRHTARGGRVVLSARAEGAETVITVADNGSGIEPEELPRVFDRFWRAEQSRSRRTGGSGLGLVIVRRLVEAHGGSVTATSTPGEGSAFSLRLASASGTPAVPPG